MIVKVQRPLSPTDAPVLVYDQHRRFMTTMPMTVELEKMFGARVKFFCDVETSGKTVKFGKIVPDRGW